MKNKISILLDCSGQKKNFNSSYTSDVHPLKIHKHTHDLKSEKQNYASPADFLSWKFRGMHIKYQLSPE